MFSVLVLMLITVMSLCCENLFYQHVLAAILQVELFMLCFNVLLFILVFVFQFMLYSTGIKNSNSTLWKNRYMIYS